MKQTKTLTRLIDGAPHGYKRRVRIDAEIELGSYFAICGNLYVPGHREHPFYCGQIIDVTKPTGMSCV